MYKATVDFIWWRHSELRVSSEHGNPSPAVGTATYRSHRDEIECHVEPTVLDNDDLGIQYECIGWRGTGSVPESGTGTSLSFFAKEDSSIEWLWATNYWTECTIAGEASPVSIAKWQRRGEALVVSIETNIESPNVVMSGDTIGVMFESETRTISIPADRPRRIFVRVDSGSKIFSEVVLPLQAGGDEPWSLVSESSASDGFCLRSGNIAQGATSTMQMTVSDPGELSFDWKISANRSDWAYFYVDDVLVTNITRSTDWTRVTTSVAGEGSHSLRWVYDRHATMPANENAAFVDNVSWRPRLAMTVSSAFGAPSPAVGTMRFLYGTTVNASAGQAIIVEGSTRRVCTGWTGSGSVPASGDAASFQCLMSRTSSLQWQWRTDHWIDVSVAGVGSTSFRPRWIEEDDEVVVELVPSTHLYSISLSGDTSGVTLDGTTLRFSANRPRTIVATISEVKLSFSVSSVYGAPNPGAGTHLLSWGDRIGARVSEPSPTTGVRYVCTGWKGTGSVPAMGTTPNAYFTIESDSSIEWQWKTNVWIAISTDGAVATDLCGVWAGIGGIAEIPFAPLAEYIDYRFSGDSDGIVVDKTAGVIRVPADRPRNVTLFAKAISLTSALDARNLSWTTSSSAPWIPQVAISADGEDSARSGEATHGDSLLETTVFGAGTFAWKWKLAASPSAWAGIEAAIDNRDVAYLETVGDWSSASVQVSGNGSHSIRFTYWAEEGGTADDRAYIDEVSWSGSAPARATSTTPEAVPYAWLDRWPALLAAHDGDYEAAAAALAANGVNAVWECYVAGLDPTDPETRFLIDIFFRDGEPTLDWTPDLGSARIYAFDGRAELADETGWQNPLRDEHRFFRARVSLPEAQGAVTKDPAADELVTVTFDPNGGSVIPSSIVYSQSGRLGDLPAATRDGWHFTGWYTDPDGGIRVTRRTWIPWMNFHLYAHWAAPLVIRFDPNGGEGSMPEQELGADSPEELSRNRFWRDGYAFAGWSNQPESVPAYSDGETITLPDYGDGGSFTLYACWTPLEIALKSAEYIAIDVSGGPNAEHYPFSLLQSVPDPATTDDFRTDKILLHRIRAGAFRMGSPTSELGRAASETLHGVGLSSDSFMGVFEVTQHQWEQVMGSNPSEFKGGKRPVECVSYDDVRGSSSGSHWPASSEVDASSFLGRLRAKTGFSGLDLPTEAQWEYACRAGTETALNSGVDLLSAYQDDRLDLLGRYQRNRNDGAGGYSEHTVVGAYRPNEWGFYDMHGNVWELCRDWYGVLSSENQVDPIGMASGTRRVAKSGSWSFTAGDCRSARRTGIATDARQHGFGFRLSMPVPDGESNGFHMICFDANGGSGDQAPVAFVPGSTIKLPSASFYKQYHTFAGWATNANGSVVYADGATITSMPTSSPSIVTLYAVWSPWKYTLKLWMNGSSKTKTAYVGQNIAVSYFSSPGYSSFVDYIKNNPNGQTLDGWSLTPNGPIFVREGETTGCLAQTDGAVVNLYAVCLPFGFKCNEANGKLSISKYNNTDTSSVVIPDSINGYPVVSISGFSGHSELTSIVIPKSVTSIADYSFQGCTGLTSVVIPDSVESIGWGAFQDCSYLAHVSLGEGLRSLSGDVFAGCSASLFDTTTIQGVGLVDGWVVNPSTYSHSASGTVNLQGIRGLSRAAFCRCENLVSVIIGEGVECIPIDTFALCANLRSVTIPSSVKRIEADSFSVCTALSEVHISDISAWCSIEFSSNPLSICHYLYLGNTEIRNLVIPNDVTDLKDLVFAGASRLTTISIPETVTTIGFRAFEDCSGLTSIAIPNSVTNIGSGAFLRCSGLSSLSLPKRFEGNTSFMCIPDGCTVTFTD